MIQVWVQGFSPDSKTSWGAHQVLPWIQHSTKIKSHQTLKIVFSSSDTGVWRVACFQGIWKRRWSELSHWRPGYLPVFTWASNQGFSRILRGWMLMADGLRTVGWTEHVELWELVGVWSEVSLVQTGPRLDQCGLVPWSDNWNLKT